MKMIQKLCVILLFSSMVYGQSEIADVTEKELKIVGDINHVLDAIVGPRNYVASVMIELKAKEDEQITRLVTPIVESEEETVNHSDKEEIDDIGLVHFLSPSLIDLSMKAEEKDETIKRSKISYKAKGYKEIETRTLLRDKIAYIRYTIILNEKVKGLPRYKEIKIAELIGQVSGINTKRGDQLEIMYTAFVEHEVDKSGLDFQIKQWCKEKNISLLAACAAAIGSLFLLGVAVIIVVYIKVKGVVKRWEKRQEKLFKIKSKKRKKKGE